MKALLASVSAAALVALALWSTAAPANAESRADISRDSEQALQKLYDANPDAQALSRRASAILIFPNVVKAGLVVGGSFGEGELKRGDQVDGYYNSVAGSVGLQAGAQSYGYVVFLMNQGAVDYVRRTEGWEVGVGPTLVLIDQGAAKNLSTSTLKDDAYAFIFAQQGLMAGFSLEGTKISHIHE
jgi:lipid-binding SYLF domain-containing protein